MNEDALNKIWELFGEQTGLAGVQELNQVFEQDSGRQKFFDVFGEQMGLESIDQFNQVIGFQQSIDIPTVAQETTGVQQQIIDPALIQAPELQQPSVVIDTPQESTGVDIPIIDAPTQEVGRGATVLGSLERGSARLGSMLAKTPAFIYDVAAEPFNMIFEQLGMPKISSKDLGKKVGIDKNVIAEYYDQAVAVSQKQYDEVYDKSLTKYLEDKDVSSFFSALSNKVAETIPVSLALILTRGAGVSTTGSVLGGGAVFGAGERGEGSSIPAALSKGILEGVFEQMGVTRAFDAILKDQAKELGEKGVRELVQSNFKNNYGKILKRFLGVEAEEISSEVATQIAQNAVDKYVDGKEVNLLDGATDAGLIAAGAGGLFGGASAATEIALTSSKRNQVKNLEQDKLSIEKDLENTENKAVAKELNKKRDEIIDSQTKIIKEDQEVFDELSSEEQESILIKREELNQIDAELDKDNISDQSRAILETQKNEIEKELDFVFGSESKEENLSNFQFIEDIPDSQVNITVESAKGPQTISMRADQAQSLLKERVRQINKLKDCLNI